MAKFVCSVCGYVHEGDSAPERCPQCKVPGDKFTKVEGEREYVTEHVIGVAKGCPQEIMEGLKAHFSGECTEVGMYLAMSRQADREGYPEIAEAFKRYAFEEAEHAAKFAELIVAKAAKKADLDAKHDTVHEMAKDKARHGRGFEGLLKRYFGK